VKQGRIAVLVVWLAFVIRGAYYCVQLPLWEGLDEWAHFAALQWFAEHGRMPAHSDLVSDEVVRSLELAPLAWSNNGWVAGAVNHDDFWRLPAAERARRRAELTRLTAAYRRANDLPSAIQGQYEAQQPPLYYALLAIPYRITSGWPIERQVLWLRCVTLLLASAAIPLAWGLARGVAASRRAAVPVAAFVAAMPAVPLYFARVSNDALACALMTLALWARRRWLIAGIALGAAMLAKAYALALVPVFLLAAWRDRKMLAALAVALAIAGWWYAGNLASTGTLARDQMAMASPAGFGATFAAVPRVAWLRVLDSGAMTHIWIGGWSFLQVRSWMYRVWELVAILGLAGLLRVVRRIDPVLAAAQLLFVLALAYFSLSTYVATGISAGVGWYALSMSAVEATLLACGFAGLFGLARARIAMGITVLLALAFDLYTVHFVLAPYYGGLIRHRPNGSLEAFHWNALPAVPALWPLYLLSNAALAWLALKTRTTTSCLYERARA
jgi:hypothetical protein